MVVGRIGRAHGVRGDIAVEVRTDAPEARFAPGVTLRTDPAERGPLTVTVAKTHSGRLLLHFRGVEDRTAAEKLAGTLLVIDPADAGPAGPGAWWDHELVGLRAETDAGAYAGEVVDVIHAPAQDLLAIRGLDGKESLLPFVAALVPDVDLARRRVVIAPPEGWAEV